MIRSSVEETPGPVVLGSAIGQSHVLVQVYCGLSGFARQVFLARSHQMEQVLQPPRTAKSPFIFQYLCFNGAYVAEKTSTSWPTRKMVCTEPPICLTKDLDVTTPGQPFFRCLKATSCFQGVTNGHLHTTYGSPNRAPRQEALGSFFLRSTHQPAKLSEPIEPGRTTPSHRAGLINNARSVRFGAQEESRPVVPGGVNAALSAARDAYRSHLQDRFCARSAWSG